MESGYFDYINNLFYYQMINLIDERGQINPQLPSFPNAPITLSIFGTQASGKSTILNHAFQTEFPVLDSTQNRGRCTKGVWFQNKNNKNIIDTQGFDSSERTEEEKIFEKQLSLFCVALSDVIIVNMYMYEIGRYSGGHLDILQTIFKVGQRLVSSQKKKIIFLIRDCTLDADKNLLKVELQKEINSLIKKYENKILKFTLDFVFMSDFIYEPERFCQEATKLSNSLVVRGKADFNNYKQQDRLLYIQELWKKIRSYQTEIDLKTIDDAIKNHIFERLKLQILQILQDELKNFSTLNDVKTYDRYNQILRKISLDYYIEHRPKHIKIEEIEAYNNKLFQLFEPICIKHFNDVVMVSIQSQLEGQLNSQIEKNKNNKKMSSTIFKKKKQITEHYKKITNNHKEYSFLLKHFNEKISEIVSKEERKFSHLFNMFEMTAEKQLNLQIDKQTQNMAFKPQVIAQTIKSLCQEYQYNEWEVDFKEIWERVTFRCMEKVIPQYIEERSVKSREGNWLFSGDQTTNIIAYHTNMQKKVITFCREILEYLHQQSTVSQPLSRVKDCVKQNLNKRLLQENRRFKISFFLIAILMLLLYGELETMAGWMMKKKKKKLLLKIYWYGALILLFGSLYREYYGSLHKQDGQKSSSQVTRNK